MLNTEVFLGQSWKPTQCAQDAAKHAQITAKRAQIEKPTWVGKRGIQVSFLSVCSAFCLNEHFCKTREAFFFVAKEASGVDIQMKFLSSTTDL